MNFCILSVEGLAKDIEPAVYSALSELVISLDYPASAGPDAKGRPSVMLTPGAVSQLVQKLASQNERPFSPSVSSSPASSAQLGSGQAKVLTKKQCADLSSYVQAFLRSAAGTGLELSEARVVLDGVDTTSQTTEAIKTGPKKRDWMTYEDAKAFVQSLGLSSSSEYQAWVHGDIEVNSLGWTLPKRPPNIPVAPFNTYCKDFEGFSVFLLGVQYNRKDPKKKWMTYAEAKEFVQHLGLANVPEYFAWARGQIKITAEGIPLPKKPEAFPTYPDYVYGDEFEGFPLFIRSKRKNKVCYRPYAEAKAFVCGLGLSSRTQWVKYTEGKLTSIDGRELPPMPFDIPRWPFKTYAADFEGMGTWLGTGRVSKGGRSFTLLPFEQARAIVASLGIKTAEEWAAYMRGELLEIDGRILPRPARNLPVRPEVYYKENFIDYEHWLSIKKSLEKTSRQRRIQKESQLKFHEARAFARTLGLASSGQWNQWRKGILKTNDAGENLPEFSVTTASPTPRQTYVAVWQGWPDFLGNLNTLVRAPRNRRSWHALREFAHSLKLKSMAEWISWASGKGVAGRRDLPELPLDVPLSPRLAYGKQFTSWEDFLGLSGALARPKYRSFEEARKFARSLGLSKQWEWNRWLRGQLASPTKVLPKVCPEDIPDEPHKVYKEFTTWSHFLMRRNAKEK